MPRISIWYLVAVTLLLACNWRSVSLEEYTFSEHHLLTSKSVMLCDAAGSIILTTASPDSFMCITCPQCEPALICDKNGCGGPVSSGGRLQIPIELHHALACLTVQPESCSGRLMESTLAVLLLFLLAKEAILVCSMQVCSYAKRSDKTKILKRAVKDTGRTINTLWPLHVKPFPFSELSSCCLSSSSVSKFDLY